MAAGKKISSFIIIVLLLIAAWGAWVMFGSSTSFEEDKKSLYIKTGSSFNDLTESLGSEGFVRNVWAFKLLAKAKNYDKNIKPGKYTFKRGSSLYTIAKVLLSGRQTPVNLVITKLRTKEDLARKISSNFECDSLRAIAILNSNDSLAPYGLDTNTAMTLIIPNTYTLLWTTPVTKIFRKLDSEQQKFWNEDRKAKAKKLNLTTTQVYTLASIVEEETNMEEDKGKIASVYLNRMKTGMKLGADPTIKFAMKDFGLKRIYSKYLSFPSPYNTYQHAGLPPGPICTPSAKTIDAVLNAPETNYLYFVAKPDFNGYSNFASTYQEHMEFAKAYQKVLDSLMKAKQDN